MDYYSRYYEYDVMTSTTAEKVIDSIVFSVDMDYQLPLNQTTDHSSNLNCSENIVKIMELNI